MPRNWTSYQDGNTSWCLMGAIHSSNLVESWGFVNKAMGGVYGSSWNDLPGRTQLEVVEVCIRAALLAREAGE